MDKVIEDANSEISSLRSRLEGEHFDARYWSDIPNMTRPPGPTNGAREEKPAFGGALSQEVQKASGAVTAVPQT